MIIKDNSQLTQFFYVYRITNKLTHKIYIGCHRTTDLNDGYMGSGKYIARAYNKHGIDNFEKEILQFYPTEQEMFTAEAAIVTRDFVLQDSNYNLAEGGKGGFKGTECYTSKDRSYKISQALQGRASVVDSEGNRFKVSVNDPRLETKELVGITIGKATVKDNTGKILQVSVDDPRIASGELVGNTKGMAVVKDCNGNRYQVPVDDPRIASGELVGNTKGHTQTLESNQKRSNALKGIVRVPTYVSCKFCKKSTSLTNFIRWHKDCC